MSVDESAPRAMLRGGPPRRSRWAIGAPIGVGIAIVGLLGWSAWPVLRPMREVRVVQAVFDRRGGEDGGIPGAPGTGGAEPHPEHPRPQGKTVQAPGWLEPDPYLIACTALADGVVEAVEALEGDTVERGQVVARLIARDSELRLARAGAELEAAESSLALASAELGAAQTDWDEPVERSRAVAASDAMVAESRAELARLPARVGEAEATLKRLEEEFERVEESRSRGASSDLELVTLRQRVAAQRAAVAALEAEKPLLEAKEARYIAEATAARRELELRVEEKRRLAAAQAEVGRARAMVAQRRAERDEAALELERMVIRAPIDGVVMARLKTPGDKVMLGMDDPHSSHIVHLYDPSNIQVRVDVPLADAASVHVGQRCEVVVEVLPDETFVGEVTRVTHLADLQKNTLQVKVHVENPSPALRPEMLTRVKFLGDSGNGAGSARSGRTGIERVLVPADAVRDDGAASRVWVVRERRGDVGIVRALPVSIVGSREGWSIVEGGVRAGDLLAVGGQRVADGETVRVALSGEGE